MGGKDKTGLVLISASLENMTEKHALAAGIEILHMATHMTILSTCGHSSWCTTIRGKMGKNMAVFTGFSIDSTFSLITQSGI